MFTGNNTLILQVFLDYAILPNNYIIQIFNKLELALKNVTQIKIQHASFTAACYASTANLCADTHTCCNKCMVYIVNGLTGRHKYIMYFIWALIVCRVGLSKYIMINNIL